MRKRYSCALFLLGLFGVFFGLGLYVVFQGLDQLNQSSQITQTTALGGGAHITVGGAFCVLGVLCLVASLGMFLSRSDREAARHLRWLGRWRPRW